MTSAAHSKPTSTVTLTLNGSPATYTGDPSLPLLTYLREHRNIISTKDGCSGQAACGACLVEIDGKAALSCSTPMSKLDGASVLTIEGFPESLRATLGAAFAAKGAVQCGFCTPGFLTRTKILLDSNTSPTLEEVRKALRMHLCRCTGYVKIVDAVFEAARALREGAHPAVPARHGDESPAAGAMLGGVLLPTRARAGSPLPKLDAFERAIGAKPFASDMSFPGMLHGAPVFSEHPRARVLSIDVSAAAIAPGVARVITAPDVPGERTSGILKKDWPILVAEGETTRYIGDVLAIVAAETEAQARAAAKLVRVEYEALTPITCPEEALASPVAIHEGGNVLARKVIRHGEPIEQALAASFAVARGVFTTPAIEHGFLETECGLAVPVFAGEAPAAGTGGDGAASTGSDAGGTGRPDGDALPGPGTGQPCGVHVFSQTQGIWHDRANIARVLGLPEEAVRVTRLDAGGAFGGKEDLSAQGHAALIAYLTGRPAKVKFTRPESIRFHPKRHAMKMEYALGCDREGRLTALRARIIGDTGAYASLGGPVMARAANHATGGYCVASVDIESVAVFTNNIPAGAMRGFGVNQVTFAMESLVEELCARRGFDPWRFRYDNALDEGRLTASGQRLGGGIGLRKTLEAVREDFQNARHAGLACGIKNTGIGGGVVEECLVKLTVGQGGRIVLDHGWTEMGQGLDTVAAQILCETIGMEDATRVTVRADTASGALAGSTTASRGTFQLGRAVIDAGEALKKAMDAAGRLEALAGQVFTGRYVSDDTQADGPPGEVRSHVSYSFATHLAILDEAGRVEKIVAAHDSGRVINPLMCEAQVQGGVAMGYGFGVSERLSMEGGRLVSEKLAAMGIPKINDLPEIEVRLVEGMDPEGPLGAKGVGEIGSIPTAAAVANAFYRFDGKPRRSLPLEKPEAKKS